MRAALAPDGEREPRQDGRPPTEEALRRVAELAVGSLPFRRQALLPAEVLTRDLNPIEQLFAELKHRLRKAARRTIHPVWQAIGQILDTATSAECWNYFANAGYEPA